MKLKKAMGLAGASGRLVKAVKRLRRQVRELKAEREHWEADAQEQIREWEEGNPRMSEGLWLVQATENGGRHAANIAHPDEIANPINYAGYAQHQMDLAHRIVLMRKSGAWNRKSAYDIAEIILKSLYEADEQRQGKEPQDGE